jgi:hypothetical protein
MPRSIAGVAPCGSQPGSSSTVAVNDGRSPLALAESTIG